MASAVYRADRRGPGLSTATSPSYKDEGMSYPVRTMADGEALLRLRLGSTILSLVIAGTLILALIPHP